MELGELQEHIQILATIEETDSPMISCYLDLRDGARSYREELDARIHLLRHTIAVSFLPEFEHMVSRIETLLSAGISARTKGLAVFARAGRQPFWLALQFEVPLPNWIAAGSTPNIYHLVELKDNYDRYVILLATQTSARIIGVNLGSATAQLWRSRPELRRRLGHQWTKDHFQDHRRERTNQFIHDQIRSLDQITSAGGYGHLILAGNARIIGAVRRALPKRLAAKLVDSVPACAGDHLADIVASTLQTFLEHEELESQAVAEKLIDQIRTHGLAVAGTRASMEAINTGQADVLILVKGYDPGQGWQCRGCGKIELERPRPDTCPACRTGRLREFDIRGELARLAEQQGVGVEVVEHNDILMSLGGVGCLLRYSTPTNPLFPVA
jgi:protein required for attachment to host cells